MADSPRQGSVRSQRRAGTPSRSSPSAAQRLSGHFAEESPNNNAEDGYQGGRLHRSPGDLRPEPSRFSLNEQFAASRQEFEFDDDADSFLEPAPIIDSDVENTEQNEEEEDSDFDVSDSTIRRLLHANDQDVDFYSVLGLPRDPPPTTAQIRAAYHRMSLAFHPDKHPQYLKAAAERQFTRLQKAYETLIEPRKRVVYDLEGEEGIQNEYKMGGAMGKGGEAEKQIGVKTMNAEEFKKWFLAVLKQRERDAIDELVGSSGTYKVNLTATNAFQYPRRTDTFTALDGSHKIEVPAPLVSSDAFSLHHNFTVGLPALGRIFQARSSRWISFPRNSDKHLDSDSDAESNWHDAAQQNIPHLTFSGKIAGDTKELISIMAKDPDGNEIPSALAPAPFRTYSLQSPTGAFKIGAHLEHSFPELVKNDGEKSIASVLQGLDLDVAGQVWPHRTFSVGLGRSISLVHGTRPFYCYLNTKFRHQPYIKPPILDFRVSRLLGNNQSVYFKWNIGENHWPSQLYQSLFMSYFKSPTWVPRDLYAPAMRIGHVWTESSTHLRDPEDIDIHFDEPGQSVATRSNANQSWLIEAEANPSIARLFVTYGRDLFVQSTKPPVRSRIMNSGEAVPKKLVPQIPETRAVRLELEANIDLDCRAGGTIRGVRRFGDFTSVGLGVGVAEGKGLFVTFSWKRLSQNIIIPVLICPEEAVNTDAILFALGVPWAVYAAIEFVILRPRMRRKRERLVARKRRELRENIAKRRAEAEQAVQLMSSMVEHRQAIERDQGGLVILDAKYGVREMQVREKKSWRPGEVADVTTALAALVNASQLSLPRRLHKSQIIGFWDPAPLTKKVLTVRYMFEGKEHFIEVSGNQALSIPMRTHES
ncbi:MAG: DNAJC11 domain-containing protein [Janthinobacterium lividum]